MSDPPSPIVGHGGVRRRMFCSVALGVLFLLGVQGCGRKSQIDRKPVYGNIVGAAGRDGVVIFTPMEATVGPTATGDFEDGAYRFTKEDGPVPGEYKVTIELVVSDSSPAATQNRRRGSGNVQLKSKDPAAGGRAAFEPPKTTTVLVPVDGPFEIDLNPTESASRD